jgi:GNAT superfamily N-acetyltransferase
VSLVIREARAADIPALAALVAASYRDAFAAIIGEAGLALRKDDFFVARFQRELAHLRLAEADGDILGMAEMREGMLDMLFVRPGATGHGIGAALLADAEERGAVRLECFAENAGARRFYVRHGWREGEAYERDFAGGCYRFVALAR